VRLFWVDYVTRSLRWIEQVGLSSYNYWFTSIVPSEMGQAIPQVDASHELNVYSFDLFFLLFGDPPRGRLLILRDPL